MSLAWQKIDQKKWWATKFLKHFETDDHDMGTGLDADTRQKLRVTGSSISHQTCKQTHVCLLSSA